ncbi:UDP-xylose and UDP-N-acetylglucosamine transporter-like [Cimex lectularius]|uniref:UDP-xylose and UDP-N-acetylglucosamine transporter n=1 Tax=Cimex lectularius TaxID=79782 RepID=A0A8I6RNN1_CIMLE|nr:UDP-xylose and UDP-N-acetylglucosamine transporter-like [Cimex lectularius]
MGTIIGTCGVYLGCMSNAVYLEYLVKEDPGIGNLVTFSSFLFIAVVGVLYTLIFRTPKRQIPIRNYMLVVVVFFTCNVCNNMAFNFKISMPLHMIFRSGSLITNMLMTILILRRKYALSKYLSVGLITSGVILSTLASGKEMKDADKTVEDGSFFLWLLGIGLLIFGLLISALLGIFQEQLFKHYGKHPYEALFYTHLLSIPVFGFFSNNILEHFWLALDSRPMGIPVLNIQIPFIIYYLIGNMVTQSLCIGSVYFLATEASTLTVTLVITLRKFLSLILSIVYFQNPFTLTHWLGTFLVFIGTVIYSDIPQKLKKH